MAILIHKTIEELIKQEPPLIENYSKDSIEAASYDMKLGKEYIKEGKKTTLTETNQTIILKPGEFAILSSYEKINMPLNLIGHNGIMSRWARRGLVSLFSPQIDPGFMGILMVPVYNAGDSEISLSLNDKIFTIEFATTDKISEKNWTKNHSPQNSINVEAQVPTKSNPILQDINTLKEEVKEIKNDLNNIRDNYKLNLTKLGIWLAVLGFLYKILTSNLASEFIDKVFLEQTNKIEHSKNEQKK